MKGNSINNSLRSIFKNPYAIVLSWIFAVGMVIGYSYYTTESWMLLYDGTLGQSLLALFVCLSYSIFYLGIFTLLHWLAAEKPQILRRTACCKVEEVLFEKHSFWGPFIVFTLFTIPYVTCFFPGTVSMDARGQIYSYFAPSSRYGHHPIGSTMVMGWFIHAGRTLFSSDSIGIFFYTGIQTLIQLSAMASVLYYQKRLKSPFVLRWATLGYFSVFPLFQMWGFTVNKDSTYYIAFTYMILGMLDYLREERKRSSALLLTISSLVVVVFRKEGRYVVVITLILLLFNAKQYWRDFCISGVLCVCTLFLIEGVYMPVNGIEKGSIKEMLSLPLQQTGRYLWLHADEITPEERELLEEVFKTELEQVGYVKETSDCIKGFFKDYPDSRALMGYFKVWYKQGLKHPATYMQAILNQMYGYFYPPRRDIRDEIAYFGFSFDTALYEGRDNVSATFAMENSRGRETLKKYMEDLYQSPLVGGLYRAGTHTFLLLGMIAYLLHKKQYKKIVLMVPSVLVLLVAIASPLNASIRYMIPIYMVLPIHFAWCTERK